MPGVSRQKNSNVKHEHSASMLSCNGATVSKETTQVVLNPYQTFHPQSADKWVMILFAKNHW